MPSTFCVANPDAPTTGMCVARAMDTNFECRPYDAFEPSLLSRFMQPAVTATVCMPHSRGWVGDHCLGEADCTGGTTCKGATAKSAGVCTMSCDKVCADMPAYESTFCAAVPSLQAGGSCVRQCTPGSNGSECPADEVCQAAARNGQPGTVKNVCMPKAYGVSSL